MADKRIVTVDYLESEGLTKGYIHNNFANALKGNKSNTAILIDDVSPVTHEMGVRVRGKNLCVDVSDRTDVYFSGSPTVIYNVTGSQLIKGFAVNGNATNYHITDFVNSNGTVSFKTNNVNYTIGIDVRVVQGETYTVSANITGGTNGSNPIWIVFLKDGLFQSYTTAQSFTVPNNCNQAILLIRPSAANTECSFSNVQLELGTTATAYAPYVPDLTAVKVSRCGKNLFNKSTLRIDSATKNLTQINNGFTFQTNATKTTMSVTCDIFLSVGTYYCRGTVSSSDGLNGGWGLYDPIKGVYIINASSRGTVNDRFTITESKTYKLSFFASYNSVADVTMTFTNIQLELGTTATDYEPYKECAEYTPNADGVVNGVTSLYPNTALMTDTEGVIIDCEYNRDINKAFAELQQAIISLGGNV